MQILCKLVFPKKKKKKQAKKKKKLIWCFLKNKKQNKTKTWKVNSWPNDPIYGIVQICHHWFRKWLVACSAPSHHLNQCWLFVNWCFRNKLQWNLNQNIKLVIQQNAFKNFICKVSAIFIKHFVAVAAYVRLARQSQAKISQQRIFRPISSSTHRSTWAALAGFRPRSSLEFSPRQWTVTIH